MSVNHWSCVATSVGRACCTSPSSSGGTPALAILNPIFWALTIVWFVAHPTFMLEIFPAPVYYLALLSWAFGNFLLVYMTVMSCHFSGRGRLLVPALLVPLYWVMMSLAAVKAFGQMVGAPAFWEKTVHGLNQELPAEQAEPSS